MKDIIRAYFTRQHIQSVEQSAFDQVIDPLGQSFDSLEAAAEAWAQQFIDCSVSFHDTSSSAQAIFFELEGRYDGYYDFHLPDGKVSLIEGSASLRNRRLKISLDFAQLQAAMSNQSDTLQRKQLFAPRTSIEQIEEDYQLAPKFDKRGLIPVITTDYDSGEVLMQGYMNQEALERSIATAQAHYWSRSRQLLWHKGASSGLYQHIIELRIDDDQDVLWMRVRVDGNQASCHVGYRSCFYRAIPLGQQAKRWQDLKLEYLEKEKVFDPLEVYGDVPNPTLI